MVQPAGVKSGQSFLAANTGHKGFKITADLIGMCWVELTAVIAGWIQSAGSCLAMGMPSWLPVVPAARQGQRLLSVLTVVLIRLLCWAWECCDNSNDDVPRLAGASAGLLPCCPGEAATPVGAEPTGCDLGMTPQRVTPGWRRDLSKHLARPMLQQALLEASVAEITSTSELLSITHHLPASSFPHAPA